MSIADDIRAAELEQEVEAAERERAYAVALAAGAKPREWLDTASDEEIAAALAAGDLQHLL
ncbi:MAG: hypothetical protein ACJ752_14085 [Gaiellaceae bacterium]